MAKLEHTLSGDFNQWLSKIEEGILNGIMSASLEDSSDFRNGDLTANFALVLGHNVTFVKY